MARDLSDPEGLAAFGFDRPVDEWLARLRRIAGVRPAGIRRYTLLEEHARGAQGVVHRALDASTHRQIAVKRLSPLSVTAERRARFRREIEIASRVSHPNVVRAFAAPGDGGEAALAMEWLDASPITSFVDRLGGRPVRPVLEVMLGVCAGVEHLHRRGVRHRDLKPDNILVTRDGVPRVVDLGSASLTGEGLPWRPIGRDAGTCGDVLALGAVLFELLTGHALRPSRGMPDGAPRDAVGDAAARAAGIRHDLGPALVGILDRSLARDPTGRPCTLPALAEDLRRHLARLDGAATGA